MVVAKGERFCVPLRARQHRQLLGTRVRLHVPCAAEGGGQLRVLLDLCHFVEPLARGREVPQLLAWIAKLCAREAHPLHRPEQERRPRPRRRSAARETQAGPSRRAYTVRALVRENGPRVRPRAAAVRAAICPAAAVVGRKDGVGRNDGVATDARPDPRGRPALTQRASKGDVLLARRARLGRRRHGTW